MLLAPATAATHTDFPLDSHPESEPPAVVSHVARMVEVVGPTAVHPERVAVEGAERRWKHEATVRVDRLPQL